MSIRPLPNQMGHSDAGPRDAAPASSPASSSQAFPAAPTPRSTSRAEVADVGVSEDVCFLGDVHLICDVRGPVLTCAPSLSRAPLLPTVLLLPTLCFVRLAFHRPVGWPNALRTWAFSYYTRCSTSRAAQVLGLAFRTTPREGFRAMPFWGHQPYPNILPSTVSHPGRWSLRTYASSRTRLSLTLCLAPTLFGGLRLLSA